MNFAAIPFRSTMPVSPHFKPFTQIINIHDSSFLLYRSSQTGSLYSLRLSGLATRSRYLIPIKSYLKDIPDDVLEFYWDLKVMQKSQRMYLYVMIGFSQILRIEVNTEFRFVSKALIRLNRDFDVKRVLVYDSRIYILEPNMVTRISFEQDDFNKFRLEHKKMQREFNDMAFIEGNFVFVRGYANLIVAKDWWPESPDAYLQPRAFHHGRFKSAGFNHFVLARSLEESSPVEYYYFYRDEGDRGNDPKSLKFKKLNEKLGKDFKRLVQFKEAMYYINKKTIAVEYFQSSDQVARFGRKVYGQLFGLVGIYNRTLDSIHPLQGYRIGLKRKFRLKKIYLNFLQSELVCKSMPLKKGENRVLKAKIQTTKNNIDYDLKFIGYEESSINDPTKREPHSKHANHSDYHIFFPPVPSSSSSFSSWLYWIVLASLVLLFGFTCCLRNALRRQIRGMLTTQELIQTAGAASAANSGGSAKQQELELSATKNSGDSKANSFLDSSVDIEKVGRAVNVPPEKPQDVQDSINDISGVSSIGPPSVLAERVGRGQELDASADIEEDNFPEDMTL